MTIYAYIYCRVAPDNHRVAHSDRFAAQEKRCKEFLSLLRFPLVGIYHDEGNINPCSIPRGLSGIYNHILMNRHRLSCLICDHPDRLGAMHSVRSEVLKQFGSIGCLILPVTGKIQSEENQIINRI